MILGGLGGSEWIGRDLYENDIWKRRNTGKTKTPSRQLLLKGTLKKLLEPMLASPRPQKLRLGAERIRVCQQSLQLLKMIERGQEGYYDDFKVALRKHVSEDIDGERFFKLPF